MATLNWEKSPIARRTLEITRRYTNGTVSRYYQEDAYSLDQMRYITLCIYKKEREIGVTIHWIRYYSLTLQRELPAGTLGMYDDSLSIGVIDKKDIFSIARRISDSNNEIHNFDSFLFEKGKLFSYEGSRPAKEYSIDRNPVTKKLRTIATPLPGFTHGIPDDRDSVTNPLLDPHYLSFQQLRPDLFHSLEACLSELRK